MSSVTQAVRETADRLRTRQPKQIDEYAFCPQDRYWFRPSYTDGKCPLCGAIAPGGAPPPPLFVRMDKSWIGLGLFALVSVGMSVLVLVMYFAA